MGLSDAALRAASFRPSRVDSCVRDAAFERSGISSCQKLLRGNTFALQTAKMHTSRSGIQSVTPIKKTGLFWHAVLS
eukprot:4595475-Prymnesium_polylepis.1